MVTMEPENPTVWDMILAGMVVVAVILLAIIALAFVIF